MAKNAIDLSQVRSNYQQKKLNAAIQNKKRDDNALQQRMFKELEAKGLLRVTSIGANVDIYNNNTLVARICCSTQERADAIVEEMMGFFFQHKMNWAASTSPLELH